MMTFRSNIDWTALYENLNDQLQETFQSVLDNDIPNILDYESKRGFPNDPNKYTLLFRPGRRQEQRRQLSTIQAKFMRLPTTFRFVAFEADYDKVVKAALDAWDLFMKRAPIGGPYKYPSQQGKQKYMASATFLIGIENAVLVTARPADLKRWRFDKGDRVFLTVDAAHAAIIEHGFYKGIYKTQRLPGGILLWVKRKLKKLHPDVSLRFRYMSYKSPKTGGRGTLPVIEIGLLGDFSTPDTMPGATQRRIDRKRGK